MDGVSGGRRRLPAVRHAIVEMDELFLEALLIGRDLLCTRCARRHFPAVLGDEKRGHAAEERGGECEGDSPLRRVKRELHRVARDIGQVDPRENALRSAVLEDRGQPRLAYVGELERVRLTHHATHGVELVHEAVEQDASVCPSRQRIGVAQRGRDPGVVIVAKRLRDGFWQRPSASKVVMLHVGIDWGLECRDADEAEIGQRARLLDQPCIRGVVALVVADHQDGARRAGRLDHRAPLGDRKTHRLLNQRMDSGLGGRDRDRRVASRREYQHRVERPREQLLPGGELLGDAVLPGAGGSHLIGDIAHGRDLEAVRQLAEIVKVHDLSDQAAPDDPYAQSAGHIHPGRKYLRRSALERSNDPIRKRWIVSTDRYRVEDSTSAASGMPCSAATNGSSCSMAIVWTRLSPCKADTKAFHHAASRPRPTTAKFQGRVWGSCGQRLSSSPFTSRLGLANCTSLPWQWPARSPIADSTASGSIPIQKKWLGSMLAAMESPSAAIRSNVSTL